MTHLRYDLMTAQLDCGETRHAQEVMRSLGISYTHATPQSIADQWWFWNCTKAPDPLPKYLTPLKLDPMKCVGYGLSEKVAKEIADGQKEE